MKALILFLFLSLNAHAIRYGEEIKKEQHPAVLYIEEAMCTAVLIHPQVALTVAHCVSKFNRFHRFISFQDKKVIKRRIKSVKVLSRNLHSELSLILLNKPLENIRPYPLYEQAINHGENLKVRGFGMNEFARMTKTLRQATLSLREEFNHKGGRMYLIGPNEKNQLVCHGDSGSPYFVVDPVDGQEKLVAVTSFISNSNDSLDHLGRKQQCLQADRAALIPLYLHTEWIRSTLSGWNLL